MTRLNRCTLFAAVVIASIWTFGAQSASAQGPAQPKTPQAARTEVKAERDSISVEDVEKAAQQLVIAVQETVRKATEDPAVRVAALKVAKNAVTAAQVVVTQQAATLQAVLDALAREIAMMTEKQQPKSRSH